MNRATLALVIASFAFAADDTDLVREAALGWTAAAVKQDTAALQRFLADDLQYAHAGGQVQTKEQYIAATTKGPARYESRAHSEPRQSWSGPSAGYEALHRPLH